MSSYWFNLITVTSLLFCGCGGDSNESWERSIEPGTFALAAPLCESTGRAPEYPDRDHRAALYDFDSLTLHSFAMDGMDVVETFQDEDCLLTIHRRVAANYSGFFATTLEKTHIFDPPGCTFAVVVEGNVFDIGTGYTTMFTDSVDPSRDVLFNVTPDATGYLLQSIDEEPVRSLWENFGCQKPDRIRRQWIKL